MVSKCLAIEQHMHGPTSLDIEHTVEVPHIVDVTAAKTTALTLDNVDVHNLATPLRYEHSVVSSDRSNSLIAQLAHYTCQDGDNTVTSSNTSNRQELDGSFVVPTQPINSSRHDIHQDGDHLRTLLNSRQEVDAHFPLLHRQSSQHDIRMLCMDANIRQHQPVLQFSKVCRMSNAESNNIQQRQQRQGSNVTQMCTTRSNKRRRT